MANRTINSTRVIDPTGPNAEEVMDLSKGISVKAPDPAYHDKEFVRSLARDRTEMATVKESAGNIKIECGKCKSSFFPALIKGVPRYCPNCGSPLQFNHEATAPITYSKEALEAASAAVPHMQRGHGAQTISPAMERTLRQAQDYLRRKMDKITTPMLRAISNNGEAGYQNEDIVTGERFYLTVDEVKRELERRDGVAYRLAEEMYAAGGAGHFTWGAISEPEQKHWITAAEFVIEKYRCLL